MGVVMVVLVVRSVGVWVKSEEVWREGRGYGTEGGEGESESVHAAGNKKAGCRSARIFSMHVGVRFFFGGLTLTHDAAVANIG